MNARMYLTSLTLAAALTVSLSACGDTTDAAESLSGDVAATQEAPTAAESDAVNGATPKAAAKTMKSSTEGKATTQQGVGAKAQAAPKTTPDASARAALEPALAAINAREHFAFDLDSSDLSTYSATAPVSWVTLHPAQDAPTAQVVLFRKGVAVQTVSAHCWVGNTEVELVDKDTVRVVARYQGSPQVFMDVTHTWSAPLGHFVQKGPATAVDAYITQFGAYAFTGEMPYPVTAKLPAGAAPGAGGLIPVGTREADAGLDSFGQTLRVTVADVSGLEVLFSPGGAIAQTEADGSWRQTEVFHPTAGAAPVTRSGRVTEAGGEQFLEVVIGAGQTRAYGPYAIVGQEGGATVWDSTSGKGVVVTRGELTTF